jgi:hypothetical protein
MAEKILFPSIPPARWVFERDCVAFPSVRGSRNLLCLATLELLMERFQARSLQEADAILAYDMHKSRLQAIARAQILADKISPENEVLLTTESYALKDVRFDDHVRENPYYFRLVRQITAELEDVLGVSAWYTTAEWDVVEDVEGRTMYTLTVRDFVARVAVAFTPEQLERDRERRSTLYRLWGDLLQDRNHKQLRELLGAGQSED